MTGVELAPDPLGDELLHPTGGELHHRGLQASAALIASTGTAEGVAVELTPLGCRALLGLPAGALWDLSVEAENVIGQTAIELRERLHGSTSWDARFAACDRVLGRLAGEPEVVSRGFTVRDPEGNLWSFGTYRGE